MVRFWQAGEDNTKKVDLWMSKLSIKKQNLQPLGATESLATKRAGQLLTTGMQTGAKVGVPCSRLLQRSQLKTTTEIQWWSARLIDSTKEPKPRPQGPQSWISIPACWNAELLLRLKQGKPSAL